MAQSELATIDLAGLWVRSLLTNRTRLADDPCPAGSFSYGSPDLRRLRIGQYRVLNEITKEASRSGTSLAALQADTAGRSSRRLVPGYSGGIKRYGRWALISVVKFRQDWGVEGQHWSSAVFGVADEYAAVLRMVADFDAVAAA